MSLLVSEASLSFPQKGHLELVGRESGEVDAGGLCAVADFSSPGYICSEHPTKGAWPVYTTTTVQAILVNDCPSTLALLCYYILYLYREKYHD